MNVQSKRSLMTLTLTWSLQFIEIYGKIPRPRCIRCTIKVLMVNGHVSTIPSVQQALNKLVRWLVHKLVHYLVMSNWSNGRVHNRHRCRKTTVLGCHRCLINTGVEKNEQHLNIDSNFDHQMSLSKSKC